MPLAPTPVPQPGPENIFRGFLFALIAVPVGIALWVLIWEIGVVSAIVAFAVAAGAAWLYRKGSGGRVSRAGAFVIAGIVLFTVLAAFWAGLVWDYAVAVGGILKVGPLEALTDSRFWPAFNADFGAMLSGNALNLVFALVLGLLGGFSVVRRAFIAARTAAPVPGYAAFMPPATPPAPQGMQLNTGSAGTLNGQPLPPIPPAPGTTPLPPAPQQ